MASGLNGGAKRWAWGLYRGEICILIVQAFSLFLAVRRIIQPDLLASSVRCIMSIVLVVASVTAKRDVDWQEKHQ